MNAVDTLTIPSEMVPIVRSSLQLKRRALEFSLSRYEDRLSAFEERYSMSSQSFAAKFEAGELADDAHWFEWQYLLEAHRETLRQLDLLDSLDV